MLNNIINIGFMHRLTAREIAGQLFFSERPLSEIASAVGFGSVAGFYREFTKKFGIPPAKYRENKS